MKPQGLQLSIFFNRAALKALIQKDLRLRIFSSSSEGGQSGHRFSVNVQFINVDGDGTDNWDNVIDKLTLMLTDQQDTRIDCDRVLGYATLRDQRLGCPVLVEITWGYIHDLLRRETSASIKNAVIGAIVSGAGGLSVESDLAAPGFSGAIVSGVHVTAVQRAPN